MKMKKAETVSLRPSFSSRGPPSRGRHAPLNLRLASALPRRLGRGRCLGLPDRFLVVPAATAGCFVHAGRILVDRGFGLAVATPAESRTAPGRELIDRGGPLIQIRIHW